MINIKIIKITPLTSSIIMKCAGGRVKNANTINYKTLLPVKGGLFCSKIFTKITKFSCGCINLYNIKPKNLYCKICGYKIYGFTEGRQRIGYIKLNSPFVHYWHVYKNPYIYSLLLNLDNNIIINIAYSNYFVVIKSVIEGINKGSIFSEYDYYDRINEYGDKILIETGGSALLYLLKNINLVREINFLLLRINTINIIKSKDLYFYFKRLRILIILYNNSINPIDLLISLLPVLPSNLRPLVYIDSSKYITADINIFYQQIIERNDRISRLRNLGAPFYMLKEANLLLQYTIDVFFGYDKNYKIVVDKKKKIKPLADLIRGKHGRFRQNLLGKRVDFSARSVIVVEPNISLSRCGLPYKICYELFRPFVIKELLKYHVIDDSITSYRNYNPKQNLVGCQKLIKKLLRRVIINYPIIINRAPTLHRMNIQAFYIYLVNDNAIHINPLICKSCNADFDGDQMAVHMPITNESKCEMEKLMFSENNIFSPANGEIIYYPTNEAMLGIYYLTLNLNPYVNNILIFSSFFDVIVYYQTNIHDLFLCIYFLVKPGVYIYTTIGRVLFFSYFKYKDLLVRYNCAIKSSTLIELFNIIFQRTKDVGILLSLIQKINVLGYKIITSYGYSLGLLDYKTKFERKDIYINFGRKYLILNNEFKLENISIKVYLSKVQFLWSLLFRILNNRFLYNINLGNIVIFNKQYVYIKRTFIGSVYNSGAKNIVEQIKHICCNRGLVMTKNIYSVRFPIFSNLFNGLSPIQYFISAYGARKGLCDTSINTAISGYLTRRLVNSSQDNIIKIIDCNTKRRLMFLIRSKFSVHVYKKILGRYLALDIYNYSGNILYKKNTLITKEVFRNIKNYSSIIFYRSPTLCDLKLETCMYCYGISFNSKSSVDIGTPVGILAAQSLGEPGTQLTMRTFHTGGFSLTSNITSKIILTNGFVNRIDYSKITKIGNYEYFVNNFSIITIFNFIGVIIKQIYLKKGSMFFFRFYNNKLLISFNTILDGGYYKYICLSDSFVKYNRYFVCANRINKRKLNKYIFNNKYYFYILNNCIKINIYYLFNYIFKINRGILISYKSNNNINNKKLISQGVLFRNINNKNNIIPVFFNKENINHNNILININYKSYIQKKYIYILLRTKENIKKIFLQDGYLFNYKICGYYKIGEVIIYIPNYCTYKSSISDNLLLLSNIFELVDYKNKSIVSNFSGYASYKRINKKKFNLINYYNNHNKYNLNFINKKQLKDYNVRLRIYTSNVYKEKIIFFPFKQIKPNKYNYNIMFFKKLLLYKYNMYIQEINFIVYKYIKYYLVYNKTIIRTGFNILNLLTIDYFNNSQYFYRNNASNMLYLNNIVYEYKFKKINKCMNICFNTVILKGDILKLGRVPLYEILRVCGINYFINFFTKTIINIFKTHGINVNIIHIEIILKTLCKLIIIQDVYVTRVNRFSIVKSRYLYKWLTNYVNKRINYSMKGSINNIFNIIDDFEFFRDWDVNFINKRNINYEYNNRITHVSKFNRCLVYLYKNIIIGISKAVMITSSFIAAASFKQSLNVIYSASIYCAKDYLLGSRESIIFGKLISMGTGYINNGNN